MAKMGRPPMPREQVRTEHVGVRLTREERERLERAADGQPISEWIRDAALRAARRRTR